MSLHSSLKRAEKLSATRSVMKRAERLKWLKEKGTWKEGSRVSGLPKIKVMKLKTVKKEKKEEKPAETTTVVAAPDAQAAVKPQTAAKSEKPQAATKTAQPKK